MDQVGVHLVSTLEDLGHAGVVLFEDGAGINGELVRIAEESVAEELVHLIEIVELMLLHLAEMGDDLLRDLKGQFAVLARIEPLVASHREAGVEAGDAKGRIDADALESTELLRVHAPHGRADDQGWLLLCDQCPQHRQRLHRINRNVGRENDDLVRRALFPVGVPKQAHGAARPRGRESMEIQQFLVLFLIHHGWRLYHNPNRAFPRIWQSDPGAGCEQKPVYRKSPPVSLESTSGRWKNLRMSALPASVVGNVQGPSYVVMIATSMPSAVATLWSNE